MILLRHVRFVLLALFLPVLLGSLPAQTTPGLDDYTDGLDHMSNARWKDAVASFDRAVGANSENASFWTARGVAKTLAEDFAGAQKDFDRSLRLRPNDKETKTWKSTSARMLNPYDMASNTGILYGADNPREYAIFIYNNLVISYTEPGAQRGNNDRSTVDFPRAGAWFAQIAFGRPMMAPALRTRAQSQIDKGDFIGALVNIERILAIAPEDVDALRMQGFARLGYGDAATARTVFTRVLTSRTTDGEAYAGRAAARARLGDAGRAREDLELARKLGARNLADAEKAIGDAPASREPREKLVAAFREGALANVPWDDLLGKAVSVQRSLNATRRRWDERYQDRLRELEAALAAKPNDVERYCDLGEFLFDNSGVRGEEVEPRSGWRGYRYQTDDSKAREIARAEELIDQALAKNGNHLRALGMKVRLRLYYNQNADAAEFYKKMLALGANDTKSIIVYAEMLDAMSWQKANEAASLRAQDGSVTYSGDWMTTRYLTDEGWRQVREKEALAAEFAQLAEQTLEQAAKALKGTAKGDYYQGKLHLRRGEYQQARDVLEHAVKTDPEYIQAYDLLGSAYARLGDEAKAFENRVTAWNKLETSAGLILPLARAQIVGARFQTARGWLDQALGVDPGDSRIYAYYGVSLAEEEKREEALSWFRAALAMEEARATLQGTSYQTGGKDMRSIGDFALSMAVRERMCALLKDLGRPPRDRMQLARASTLVDQRIPMSDWTTPAYGYMIPSLDEEPNGLPPQVPEAVVLLARARILAGQASFDMADYKAADEEYKTVYTYQKRYQEYTVDRATNNELVEASRWASIGWGYTLLKLDNYERALWCVSQIPPRSVPQNDLERAGVQLAAAVKKYKDEHGILTEQEKQIKELDEMNAANRRMVEDALKEREEQNRQFDEQRRREMEEINRRNREVDEQRRRQGEDMRRQPQRRNR